MLLIKNLSCGGITVTVIEEFDSIVGELVDDPAIWKEKTKKREKKF